MFVGELTVSEAEPPVGKEVIDLRSRCGRKSGQHIFDVLKRIYSKSFACFDETHDDCCRLSSCFGTSEQPVTPANDHWFDTAFAGVVTDFDERIVEVNQKSRPTIERVRDCFSELRLRQNQRLHFVKPGFEKFDFGSSKSISKVIPFFVRESCCFALNVEQTFEHAHWEFCSDRIISPGIFKITMDMSPAVSRSSTIFDYLVVFVCPVGLQYSQEAIQHFFRIDRVLRARVLENHVREKSITPVHPDEALVGLTSTALDDRKSGRIRLNNTAPQDVFLHSIDNRFKKIGNPLHPSAHGGAVDRYTQRFKDLFLAVEWKVQEEFVGSDLRKKTRTNRTFVDWLIRLLCGDDLSVAFFASIFVHDVANIFKNGLDELGLPRNLKTNDFTRFSATRAKHLGDRKMMLFIARWNIGRRFRATAAFFLFGNDVQFVRFAIKFRCSLIVNSLAGSSEEGSIDFRRLSSERSAFLSTELLFELSDAGEELSYQIMASTELIWKIIMRRRTRSSFWHVVPLVQRAIAFAKQAR